MTLREQIAEENPEALFADGLDEALVGMAVRCGQPVLAVYDYIWVTITRAVLFNEL